LAQIDPAPFQAQLEQSLAKKAQDEAQLRIAQVTLERDKDLLNNKILAQQDYDTQKAMVDQLEAVVKADQALIDNARIQLAYTTISSPLDGRTGIRMIDQGNIVHATDSNGLVVITQLKPISLSFTLPEQNLQQIRAHLPASGALTTLAMDRDNRTTISQGKLAVIDNQIDTSTGTIRLKSTFANDDLKLWPGQFVNVRLLLETRRGPVVPASVVQHGPDGDFAFVITPDLTAQVRKIKVAQIDRGKVQRRTSPGPPLRHDKGRRYVLRSKGEHFRAFYTAADRYVAFDGGRRFDGPAWLLPVARVGLAPGGFSHHPGYGAVPRRRPGCNGLIGNDPSGAAVWADQWAVPNDFHQLIRQFQHHPAI
jgi:RND family efflux transporter MFP subunit